MDWVPERGLKATDRDALARCDHETEEALKLRQAIANDYPDNPLAQEQIRIYDPNSQYIEQARRFIEAMQCGQMSVAHELDGWFQREFPYTERHNRDQM